MRELDSILDPFLSKGYEECTGEKDVVELHREHGVCIKIKKEFNVYSIKLLLHSQVKMMGTIARALIKETMDELGSGIVVNSSHSAAHVEIKVSGTGLTYRKLEHCVDVFYMKFHERYLGLIQSAQMRMYHMESKTDSYESLVNPSPIGEYRDTSHEGRVHSEDSSQATYSYSTGPSTTTYNSNYSYSSQKNSNIAKGFLKAFAIFFVAIFVIGILIAIFIPDEYDINGYMFDAYDYVADGWVEEYDNDYGEGYTSDGYAYLYVYYLEYDEDTVYTEVVMDVNKYLNYLQTEMEFTELFAPDYWDVEGEEFMTTHTAQLTNGDIIYVGVDWYQLGYTYYVDVVFVYEMIDSVSI